MTQIRRFVLICTLLLLAHTALAQQTIDEGCWTATRQNLLHDAGSAVDGWKQAPSGAIKPHNLKWELPIAAATGVLIAWVDVPAANHARSLTIASSTGTASNVLLGTEIGVTGLTYALGCTTHHPEARDAGLTALAGMGYAFLNDLALKAAFNRQYPYTAGGDGEFWEGGKSFPSGHASASWGLASALAQRYHNRPLIKWTAYGAAASISMLRFNARKHFPSDILVGATLGYVAGQYIAQH